jgi:hypothetical protein
VVGVVGNGGVPEVAGAIGALVGAEGVLVLGGQACG